MSKLVRDKIPTIIKNSGNQPITHIASDVEYESSLRNKLQEEVDEYIKDGEPAELVDIMEVVYALGKVHQITASQLESLRAEKNLERGRFDKRIILEKVKKYEERL
jgi:predicted house-cleaning noncanonical NTP pyrophosphatase (MazG superfamily)